MLSIFKKTVDKQTSDVNNEFVKKEKPDNNSAKAGSGKGGATFGGMSNQKIMDALAKGKSSSTAQIQLTSQTLSESAMKAMDDLKVTTGGSGIKVAQSSSLQEEIATMFAEGEIKSAIDFLRKHITSNQGKVEQRYWFMLMDIYQINNQQLEFEKAALLFARTFNCSPPSWPESSKLEKTNSLTGKNLLILVKLHDADKEIMKEFSKSAKEEKFCRIDVSKIKFDDCNLGGFNMLLQTMYELRKSKVLSVLLGENHLLNFCRQYMKIGPDGQPLANVNVSSLNSQYVQNETIFWLLYLEIMQWKNRPDEFEDAALNYAVNFEQSAPGWDDNGVMRIESSIIQQQMTQIDEEDDTLKIEKIITNNNVQPIFDYIQEQVSEKGISSISLDLKNVDRFDFASAGSFLSYMQIFQESNSGKKVVLRHPNELVLCLFETIGLNEFLHIEPKIR